MSFIASSAKSTQSVDAGNQSLVRDHAPRSTPVAFGRLILGIGSAAFLVTALLQVLVDSTLTTDWANAIAWASLLWMLLYFTTTWWITRTPYLLTSAYVIVLVLFHLGVTLPDGFGLFSDISWGTTRLAKWLELAGWYTVLALSALGVGFAVGWRGSLTPSKVRATPPKIAQQARKTAFWAGSGLLLASCVFFALAISSYGNLFAYSRIEFYRGAGDTRGWHVFMMALPSAAVLLCVGAQTAPAKLLSSIFALMVAAFFLFTGYRSAALFPALAGIILWARTGNRIPLAVAIAAFVGTILAIPAAGLWRTYHTYNELDQETIVSSFRDTEAKDTLKQGRTAGVLAQALRLTPSQDPYRFGMTYVRALEEAIPNVFPQVGESQRQRVRSSILKHDAIMRLNPGSWVTYRVAPQKFSRGEGLGFSAIGEAYINFGWAGVVGVFGVLGFLLARLDSTNLLYHPYLLVFCGAMYWPLLRTVRNDFANFVKPFGFLLITLLIWAIITRILPIVRPGRRPSQR